MVCNIYTVGIKNNSMLSCVKLSIHISKKSIFETNRMDHGDRGMRVSDLRYEEEDGEFACTCGNQACGR